MRPRSLMLSGFWFLSGLLSISCSYSTPRVTYSVIHDDESLATTRGTLLTESLVDTLSLSEVNTALAAISSHLANSARYPISLYRLTYDTINVFGQKTTASGTLAVPQGQNRSFPLLSYEHGTEVMARFAATSSEINAIALLFASAGYVTAIPDYLGMEASTGLHPYVHADSLASATVDMLRAVRAFDNAHGKVLNRQLFIAGYSEGGYAAMATSREIEANEQSEFTITASAPMAGPYDLSGTMANQFLDGKPRDNSYYLPYVILAYNDIYDLVPSLSDIFVKKYADLLPTLFDGLHNSDDLNGALPRVPSDMLTPQFIEDFKTNPRNPLREALQDNDLYHWKPKSPMRLYHCNGDDQVPYQNALLTYRAFQSLGATQVQLITVEGNDHSACAGPIIFQAKLWFDSMATVE